MLLPEPVGATDRTSRPASIATTTSDCPGLNASSPKTSLSVRSALSIIPLECDGISRSVQWLLTRPQVESGHCRSSIELTDERTRRQSEWSDACPLFMLWRQLEWVRSRTHSCV